MTRTKTIPIILILSAFFLTFFVIPYSVAGDVSGTLKWKNGNEAQNQELKIMFKHHDTKHVKSDANGKIAIHWSGEHDNIKIFWKGKKVFERFIKDGEIITVFLPN